MKKVENKSGKQRPQNAELGTENRKTHDVKPRTEDTEHGTLLPDGSNFAFVYSFALPVLASGKIGNEAAEGHDGSIFI